MSVEHSDESHVSFESSSSVLPNQKLDVDGLDADDFLWRESFDDEILVDFRRNPSIALPIRWGSTNGPRESHRNRLFGFFVSLERSSLSLNRSSTSLEKDTVTLAVFRSDFFRDIGWWRFSNHPDNAAAFLSAADAPLDIICFALCKIETSKLFDRFERLMPGASGAKVFDDDVDGLGLDVVGVISSTLFISVADEASDVIIDIKSLLVTTMPVFLKKLGDDFEVLAAAADDVEAITGFSEARRLDGIGVSVEPTKSE